MYVRTQSIACSEMIILLTVSNPLTQFKPGIGGDGVQQPLAQCLCRGVLWQFEHVPAGAGSGQVLVTGARGVDTSMVHNSKIRFAVLRLAMHGSSYNTLDQMMVLHLSLSCC